MKKFRRGIDAALLGGVLLALAGCTRVDLDRFSGYAEADLVYVAPAIAFVVLAAVFGWTLVSRRSRTSYAVYTGLTLLSLAMLTWPISTPRYLLGVFPLFLAIAGPARRPEIGIPLLVGSVVLLLAFLAQFSIGGWAF